MSDVDRVMKMNDGREIPSVGLGTWQMAGQEEAAVRYALEIGYRHIDTASVYGTEAGVGRAVATSGIPREELFITTKVWNTDQGYENTLHAVDESLRALGMEYVDLYLIHWPFVGGAQGENRRADTWRAMEEILQNGKARSIGVSNYAVEQLEEMEAYATILPAINQIKRHPFWQQRDVVAYCIEHNIIVTNYSPLMWGAHAGDATIAQVADRHDKSVSQVLLRWGLQHGNIVIPKSSQNEHIKENFDVFDFELDAKDMKVLDALDEDF